MLKPGTRRRASATHAVCGRPVPRDRSRSRCRSCARAAYPREKQRRRPIPHGADREAQLDVSRVARVHRDSFGLLLALAPRRGGRSRRSGQTHAEAAIGWSLCWQRSTTVHDHIGTADGRASASSRSPGARCAEGRRKSPDWKRTRQEESRRGAGGTNSRTDDGSSDLLRRAVAPIQAPADSSGWEKDGPGLSILARDSSPVER